MEILGVVPLYMVKGLRLKFSIIIHEEDNAASSVHEIKELTEELIEHQLKLMDTPERLMEFKDRAELLIVFAQRVCILNIIGAAKGFDLMKSEAGVDIIELSLVVFCEADPVLKRTTISAI